MFLISALVLFLCMWVFMGLAIYLAYYKLEEIEACFDGSEQVELLKLMGDGVLGRTFRLSGVSALISYSGIRCDDPAVTMGVSALPKKLRWAVQATFYLGSFTLLGALVLAFCRKYVHL